MSFSISPISSGSLISHCETERIESSDDLTLEETSAIVVHSKRGSILAKGSILNFVNAKGKLHLISSTVNWVILKVLRGQEGLIILDQSCIDQHLWIMAEDPSRPVAVHLYESVSGSRPPTKVIFRFCEGKLYRHTL